MMNVEQIHVLDKGNQLECIMSEDDSFISWVIVFKLFFDSDPEIDAEKRRSFIKPGANYRIEWIRMSRKLIDAFHNNEDVSYHDAEFSETEFGITLEEVETILASRAVDVGCLTSWQKTRIRLP